MELKQNRIKTKMDSEHPKQMNQKRPLCIALFYSFKLPAVCATATALLAV